MQHTISDILCEKTIAAAKTLGYNKIAVAGGVSANSGVRSTFKRVCGECGIKLYLPPKELCGDNGAMIACQGIIISLQVKGLTRVLMPAQLFRLMIFKGTAKHVGIGDII